MRRAGVALLVLAALVVGPPAWYALAPVSAPELPPAGERVQVAAGIAVNVLDAGSGPPIVLVHGHPGTGYDWLPLQRELVARGFRVIAYDRVGYGRSDGRGQGSYGLVANADELLALIAAKRLEAVTLVGWSFGGGTSILAARKDPSQVARLVLVGSVGLGIVEERQIAPPWLFDLIFQPLISWVFRVPPVKEKFGELASAAAFAPEPITDGYLERSAANFAAPHTLRSFRSEGQDLDSPGLDPGDLELPLLVVHGDGDQLVRLPIGRRLHERAQDSELWIVPGGGHMLPLTRAPALAERIADFAGVSSIRSNPPE